MKVDMRDAFFERLVEVAKLDERVVFLSADHGAFALKEFEEKMPERYINMGISEQNMIGVAAGLAASGKIVFAYGISPFVSLRVLEQLTLDVAAMELPVHVVSVGAGFTYSTDGPTHQGLQDLPAVLTIPKMTVLNSSDPRNTRAFVDQVIHREKPHYIRIEKGVYPILERKSLHGSSGYSIVKDGESLLVICTGTIIHTALRAAMSVENQTNKTIRVIDLYEVNSDVLTNLCKAITNQQTIITIEEGYADGIGGRIGASLAELSYGGKFSRVGVEKSFLFDSNGREEMLQNAAIDEKYIANRLMNCLETSV